MKFIFILIMSLSLGACALLGFKGFSQYDQRSITVLTANLFDQRTANQLSSQSWKADWLLRRDRLELVDRSLRITRPDLIFFQDLLAKKGSPSDSDRNILAEGALQGYEWQLLPVNFYDDTQEVSFHSIATSLPLRINRSFNAGTMPLGDTGLVSFFHLDFDQDSLLVANVQMPKDLKKADGWYRVLGDLIDKNIASLNLCRQRMIIAGYIPSLSSDLGYQEFLTKFELKDSSTGYCEVAANCLTENPSNEIFRMSSQGDEGGRVDRILIPQSALVLSSQRTLNLTNDNSRYAKQYGLSKLWATRRYGWLATVRLAKCN